MKANTPENIYYTPTDGGFYLTTIKPGPPFAEGVEYTRTDAFIDKATEWLRNYSHNYANNTLGKEYLVNDFINYMKGE